MYSKEKVKQMIEIITDRISTFKELQDLAEEGEFDYFFSSPTMETKLSWKEDNEKSTREYLLMIIEKLETLSQHEFSKEKIKDTLWDYAEEKGKGSVLWPMRVALSGKEKSPNPFLLAEILGKEESLSRFTQAITSLE